MQSSAPRNNAGKPRVHFSISAVLLHRQNLVCVFFIVVFAQVFEGGRLRDEQKQLLHFD